MTNAERRKKEDERNGNHAKSVLTERFSQAAFLKLSLGTETRRERLKKQRAKLDEGKEPAKVAPRPRSDRLIVLADGTKVLNGARRVYNGDCWLAGRKFPTYSAVAPKE